MLYTQFSQQSKGFLNVSPAEGLMAWRVGVLLPRSKKTSLYPIRRPLEPGGTSMTGIGPCLRYKWKITIFNGKIHYKWPFSIAMLVHQRVNGSESDFDETYRNNQHCAKLPVVLKKSLQST